MYYNNDIHPLDVLNSPIKMELFSISMTKIFKCKHFCIVDARSGIEVINKRGGRILDELRPLHCLDWEDMSTDMASHVLKTLAKAMVYSPASVALDVLDNDVEEAMGILKDILHPRRKVLNKSASNGLEADFEGVSVPRETRELQPMMRLLSFRRKT